jgi:hypothetical protein
MFQRVYLSGLAAGADRCLIATREGLIGIFTRFGFRQEGLSYYDPVAGPMHVLILQLRDFDHLRRINSPLWETIDTSDERKVI